VGQFEDVPTYQPPHARLSHYPANSSALCLLTRSKGHPEYVSIAEDLIRFSEDQFVIWMGARGGRVQEQYGFWKTVNASTCDMMYTYLKAYEVTGRQLYLAKALALATAMANSNNKRGGYAWNMGGGSASWANCNAFSAGHMLIFSEFLEKGKGPAK
jgi:hypothetical protein